MAAMSMSEKLSSAGSVAASLMFVSAIFHQFFPSQLKSYVTHYSRKLVSLFYPYVEITFSEFAGERLKRSEAYAAIEAYLTGFSSERSRRLKAEMGGKGSKHLALTMDEYEEIADHFHGARLQWSSSKEVPRAQTFSFYPTPSERRLYRLTFHRCHRELVLEKYLPYVMEEGKAIGARRRQRRLYSNMSGRWSDGNWSHVPFEHPATFDTIAMDADKKEEIIQDLLAFTRGKDYYAKIGKPWKRGYLLYGPPGTGKSTMIAAMANLLDYDVYDLELTDVKNNTKLRKLLIETTSKSIIVIEDIDCSLDLSGRRKPTQPPPPDSAAEATAAAASESEASRDPEASKVTLSGLLNFIDGLWSSSGRERLIVFTTNHVDSLDPALIRRGRMDRHIELSYCSFEGFKVLAKNYMGIDEHPLFESVRELMAGCKITPADLAEILMPKTVDVVGGGDAAGRVEACLESLIQELKDRCKAAECKEAASNSEKAAECREGSNSDETAATVKS